MHIPFNRTLREAKKQKKGFSDTAATLLALAAREGMERLMFVPDITVSKVNKSKMIVFPKKGDINTDLYMYKKREPICTDYLINSGIIKRNDTVLDIGANIGYYALLESRLVGKTGQIYAVEPVRSTFKMLEKNVRLNNLANVSTYQLAFGDRNADAEIFVSDHSNLCAIRKDAVGGEVLGVQDVTMRTVDEFVKDKKAPNFIRMDVEGYEYEIIKGMPQTLRGKRLSMLLELHPHPAYIKPDKLEEIFQILEDNNFRVRFIVYEHKVKENYVSRLFLRKAGDKLPITGSNISIEGLRRIVSNHMDLPAPNILFEKNS